MRSLEERASAYEAEFAHREELKFRARERAVKALAIWAAECLGKTGEAAETYARKVVASDIANPKLEATIERVAGAVVPAGIGRREVDRMINRLFAESDSAVRTAH